MKNIFLILLGAFTFLAVSCQTTKDLSTVDSITPTKQTAKKKKTSSSYKSKKSSSSYSSSKKKSYIKPQSEEKILAKIDAQENFKSTSKVESSSSSLATPKVPSIPTVPSISTSTSTPSIPTTTTVSAPTSVYKSIPEPSSTQAPVIDLPRITSQAGSLDQNISLELRMSRLVK